MSNLDEMLNQAPTLTFEPFAQEEAVPAVAEEKKEEPVYECPLSDEEKAVVDRFAAQIDLHNSQQILQFGAGAQKKIADFSETALENVKTKDLGETGKLLTDVVSELKDFDAQEEEKGIFF